MLRSKLRAIGLASFMLMAQAANLYEKELHFALDAVRKASRLTSNIQNSLAKSETVSKIDASPVTVADYGVQALTILLLRQKFPDYGFVAEEDSAYLRTSEGAANLKKIRNAVNDAAGQGTYTDNDILEALDYGQGPGGARGRHWVLDPIDGTKGFLRREQYAIALGLLDEGKVVLGVMGCPNLPVIPLDKREPEPCQTGCLFYAVRGQGTRQQSLDGSETHVCRVSEVSDPAWATFCESVEAAHSSHDLTANIAKTMGVTTAPVRMDSQCKYGVLARGEASIYMRFPRPGYSENIWDHAAGAIIIEEAGGMVTDQDGAPLDFSRGRKLNTKGIVASNGRLHPGVVAAVNEVTTKS